MNSCLYFCRTLIGFYLIGRFSRQSAILWLILTSLVF
jgi:hypothetical protein